MTDTSTDSAPPRTLVVMARAPVPGQVKTRLASSLGPEVTAELYTCFIRDTVNKLTALPETCLVVAHVPAPDADIQRLRELLPEGVALRPQRGEAFGQRVLGAVREGAPAGQTVVVGTDSPSLPLALVEEAFGALTKHDIVLGPATDGGYYLVGCREPHPEPFTAIDWSTAAVLHQTVNRCRTAGLSLGVLTPWYDIDTEADLNCLAGHLSALEYAGQPCPCPATWALLQRLHGRPPASTWNSDGTSASTRCSR